MRRSNYSEQEIEELLRNLPSVTDTRPKADIYQNMQLAADKRRSPIRWIPIAACAAVIVLFSILAASFRMNLNSEHKVKVKDRNAVYQSNSEWDKKAGSTVKPENAGKKETEKETGSTPPAAEDKKQEEAPAPSDDKAETIEGKPGTEENKVLNAPLKSSLAFSKEGESHSYITISVPDPNLQYFIPLSFDTDKTDKQGQLEAVEEKMKSMNEESYGLSNYYPLNLGFSLGNEEGTVNVDFADKSSYNNSYESGLLNALEDTFRYLGYTKITFSTEGKPGIELSDTGAMQEAQLLPPKRSFLIYQSSPEHPKFIVPNVNSSAETIQDALKEMQNFEANNSAAASIPSDWKIETAAERDGVLVVTFSPGTLMAENENALLAIEAILLTAKDFGLKAVKFENAPLEKLGRYDLTKEIEVPSAPNVVE
ncbi:GerMN domain-containing protein [Peribacillus kribbensis]|uniref:GerMN domain-containing protein n=1 Tax=Peribacillus kribbensis TaxID=356658 RepID=UPI0004156984|nr:GerMN domain-containing protein [Peribacillus kribbensis]